MGHHALTWLPYVPTVSNHPTEIISLNCTMITIEARPDNQDNNKYSLLKRSTQRDSANDSDSNSDADR